MYRCNLCVLSMQFQSTACVATMHCSCWRSVLHVLSSLTEAELGMLLQWLHTCRSVSGGHNNTPTNLWAHGCYNILRQHRMGVYNRWTGPVDWTGGLETYGENVVDLC